jgi:hypothetical protein
MKMIFWNVRGVGNSETQIHLNQMIQTHKPDFLFLAEPMVNFNSVPAWLWIRLDLTNHALNTRLDNIPSIWCLWNNNYNPNVLFDHEQCLVMSCLIEGVNCYIAVIYADTYYINRRSLWQKLTDLINIHEGPWLFLGDFNSITGAHEKLGGRLPLQVACFDFINWSNLHSLIHLDTKGVKFTWTNKRDGAAFIAQRLDRAICNGPWFDCWSSISCNTLIRCYSDHIPLLLSLQKAPPADIIPRFKFFRFWTNYDSCADLIASHWTEEVTGTPMHKLHFKLKTKLQRWNKLVVGDLHKQLEIAHNNLEAAQMDIDQFGNNSSRAAEELICLNNYYKALNTVNDLWKDKSRNASFLDGDRNTAYFHRVVKIREA